MERDKIAAELTGIVEQIKDYIDILQNRDRLRSVLRKELVETTRDKFADARRTVLGEAEFEHDVEDLIQREEMVVTLSHRGYVKRVPLSTYRAQRRGGKGRAGMSTRDEDFVSQVFVVNTHTPVLFFSTAGKVYKLKVYRLPQAAPQARGKALVNLLPLADGRDHLDHPADAGRRGRMGEPPAHVRDRRGLRAPQQRERLRERAVRRQDRHEARFDDDRIIGVQTCSDSDDVLLAARGGKCIALRRRRRAPVPGPELFGRARDGPRRERPGDLHERAGARRPLEAEERDAYFRRTARRGRRQSLRKSAAPRSPPRSSSC